MDAMEYLYCFEDIDTLVQSGEHGLRLERYYGPPRDYPHPPLEEARKQLSLNVALYRLECQTRPPAAPPLDAPPDGNRPVVLRFRPDSSACLGLVRMRDSRDPLGRFVFFGTDQAVGATNLLSPNLRIPFSDIDIRIKDQWVSMTPGIVAAIRIMRTPGAAIREQPGASPDATSRHWTSSLFHHLRWH